MEKYLLFIGLLIIGCGPMSNTMVTDETKDYMIEFCETAKLYNRSCYEKRYLKFLVLEEEDFIEDVEDINPGVIAYCIDNDGVYFRRSYWNAYTPAQRKQLFYHEMGHCFLDREHQEGLTPIVTNNLMYMIPKSIMRGEYNTETSDILEFYWDDYVQELFTYEPIDFKKR